MQQDTIYNDLEEVIVNDGEKNVLGTLWAETVFSPSYSFFHPEKLKFGMVTQFQRVGKNSVTFIKHYYEACGQSYTLP